MLDTQRGIPQNSRDIARCREIHRDGRRLEKKWERTTWRLMRKMTLEARLAVVCVQNLYVIGTFSLIWVYKLVIPYWVVRKFEGNGWSWFKTLGMVNVYAPTCHLEYMLLVVTEERSSTCKSSGKLFSHSFPAVFSSGQFSVWPHTPSCIQFLD